MNLGAALRRVGLPVALAVVNLALVAVWLGVLAPLIEDFEFRKRATQNANSGLRSQIDLTQRTLETMEVSLDRYAELVARGFLDPQDRRGATKLLDKLRADHGLTSINYEIAPEKVLDDKTTRQTGFAIVSTRVTVKMLGLFDADLVEFAQAVIDEFPGQVRPLSFSLKKLAPPTEASLALLREGKLVEFVGGELVFEWNTLRPLVKQAEG